MTTSLESLLQLTTQVLSKVAPLAISFVDDALLLVLAKCGIVIPGMAWLPTVSLSATIVYWTAKVALFLYARYQTGYCAFSPCALSPCALSPWSWRLCKQ